MKVVAYAGPWLAGKTASIEHLVGARAWARGFVGHVSWRGERVAVHAATAGPLYVPALGTKTASTPEVERALRAIEESLVQAHGIIFVVDSQLGRMDANRQALERLREDLGFLGRNPKDVPLVFQLNKRDLSTDPTAGSFILPVEEVRAELDWPEAGYVSSVASRGEGVAEAFAWVLDANSGAPSGPYR